MNALGVDPKNFEFAFAHDWTAFQTTRVFKFLRLYLEMRIRLGQTYLERVGPAEVGQAQGAVQEARQLLAVLKKTSATDQMREVIRFLDENDYGK